MNELEFATSILNFLPFVQALLVLETQKTKEPNQVSGAEQAKNEELAKKLEAAEKKADQLQDSVQRFKLEHNDYFCK